MATDLGQGKSPPTAKYENFVRAQLTRAEGRIRTLDLTAALLGFAAGTLAYAVVVALLDRLLDLPPVVRQAACVVYLLASLAYLTAYVLVPLSRRINPYFAARQLERSLPGSKNSVVNWLDLHDENLPPAIRGAVGQRAARDLGRADLEKAVSARRAYGAAGLAAACGVAFLIALFTLGPAMFLARLGRTFAPFGPNAAAVATRTQITVVKPVDGDAVVADGRPVEISVRVSGRVPDARAADAPRLLFRYQPSAAYQSRLLDPDDGGRWGTTLAASDIQDGFWYKVAGGDAETKEYRVQLTPRVTDFKAVYQFRPYLARVKETRLERKIEAVRGTQVDVTIYTNRELKEGYFQLEGADGARSVTRGEVTPDDPTGFRVRLILDESSQYRICFTSTAGEEYVEQQPSPLIAIPDRAPVVTLTKPAELKEKPGWVPPLQADGLLSLEGDVTDDIGVAAIRLNLRVENGPTLPPQEYRSASKLNLPHGGNPVSVHYEDFVDLAKLKNPADPLFAVRPGMVLEYWLTAEDACDFPAPNVGESKHYRVQIVEPLNNNQAHDQQRNDEQTKKDQNDKQQDAQNQKEDTQRQEQNQKTQQNNDKGDNGKGQDSGDGGGTSGKPNDKNAEKKPDGKSGQQQNPDGKSGQQQNPSDKGNGGADNPKPSDKPQGGKGGDSANQQSKGGDQKNSGNGQEDKKNIANDLNQAIKDHQKDQEGTGKNDPKQQPAGDGKGAGEQSKDGAADARPGENKQGGDAKAQPDAQPGQGKEARADGSAQPGDKAQGDDKADKAESKGSPSPGASADARPAGDAKDKAAPENKAEGKAEGLEKPDKDAAKSEAKADRSQSPTADQKPEGSAKPEGTKSDKQEAAQRKSDGSEGEPQSEEAKRENLEKAVKQLKEDLKSNDPRRRQTAEEFIRRYMLNADDPQIREAGKKTLEEAGINPDDTNVAENKPMPPPSSDGTATANKDQEKPSEGKSGMGDNPPSAGKENPTDDARKGESKDGGKPTDKNDQTGDGKAAPPGEAKGGPGNGAKSRHGEPPPSNDMTGPPPAPEKPVEQKASVLQLRKFLDTVDKKVLQDAKRDPAAMKKLQEEARKWLAEHPPDADNETPAGPQQGGALGSTAGRRSNPDGKTATDDPDNGGRPLPPPGYRDPYKEFTKLLSPGGDK